MLSVRKPSISTINQFVARQRASSFSYAEVGSTRKNLPKGYIHDHHRTLLGKGSKTFQAACDALRRWEMFDLDWITVCRRDIPIEPGANVAVLARFLGLWWLNATRIVYIVEGNETTRRFGFAYGTLLDHVECGEERFMIEWDENDSVWYDLTAFSRPNHWLVWLGLPLGRWLQKHFIKDSQSAMLHATGGP